MTTLEKLDEQSAPRPKTVDAATQTTARILEYKERPTPAYHTLQSDFPPLWMRIHKNLSPILSTIIYTAFTSHRVYSWPWLFYSLLSALLSTAIYFVTGPEDIHRISIRHNKKYAPLLQTVVWARRYGWSDTVNDWFFGLCVALFFGLGIGIYVEGWERQLARQERKSVRMGLHWTCCAGAPLDK